MQRSVSAAVVGHMSLMAFNSATRYPTFEPRGPALSNNTLAPRKDKGSRYVWNGRTRSIAA